jgi:flagella basal body P-ring formation protein FlgA
VIILRILFTALIWCGLSTKSIGSQELISGSNLADLVTHRLNKEGLSAQPVIKKERVFYGCGSDNIIISKRDKSWKTVKLTCKNNKLWNYSFRNKIAESVSSEQYIDLQKISKNSTPKNTKKVFVLRHSKFKGDKIEKSDLVLSEKKKVFSNGAFNDLQSVLGKRLRKSLRKGAILKANHLNPDWLVYKNQRIIIEHSIGEISVKMEGIALSNGAKGDRVLAKNISSNKIIEGFVESAKKISVFNKI